MSRSLSSSDGFFWSSVFLLLWHLRLSYILSPVLFYLNKKNLSCSVFVVSSPILLVWILIHFISWWVLLVSCSLSCHPLHLLVPANFVMMVFLLSYIFSTSPWITLCFVCVLFYPLWCYCCLRSPFPVFVFIGCCFITIFSFVTWWSF